MASQESLSLIYRVQEIHSRAAAAERARAAADDGSIQAREVVQRRQVVAAAHEEALKASRAVRDSELELATAEEKLGRIQGILYGGKVSNPKELQSYEAELASLRRRKDALEDQVLALMEAADAAERQAAEAKAMEKKSHARWQARVEEYRQKVADLEAEKQSLAQQRAALRTEADPELLRAYDLAARQHKVLVSLVEDEVCSACGMRLPVWTVKEHLAEPEKEFTCPTCRTRLIWNAPEE